MARKIILTLTYLMALLLLTSCHHHILISPAITQEMRDARAAFITRVTAGINDRVVHVGTPEVSLTEMRFILENRTDANFYFGAHWDLAYFDYEYGMWVPVQYRPGLGNPPIESWGLRLMQGK